MDIVSINQYEVIRSGELSDDTAIAFMSGIEGDHAEIWNVALGLLPGDVMSIQTPNYGLRVILDVQIRSVRDSGAISSLSIHNQ